MANQITVYSTPTCFPCRAAKRRLDREGIPYASVDLTEDAEALADLKRSLGVEIIQTPMFRFAGGLHTIASLPEIIEKYQEETNAQED